MFLEYDDCIRLQALELENGNPVSLMSHGFPFSFSFISSSTDEEQLKNLDLFRVVETPSGKMLGGFVKYGENFMLQHVVSKGFLQLDKREFSKLKADCAIASVGRDSSSCLLSFLPRLKSRSEGEPVRFDDVAFLVDHKSGRLARKTDLNTFSRIEIAFGRDSPMAWRIVLCDRVVHDKSSVLCPGNYVKLQHVDTNDFVSAVGPSEVMHLKLTADEESIEGVWEMEASKFQTADPLPPSGSAEMGMTIKHEFLLKCCSKNWTVGATHEPLTALSEESARSEINRILTCSDSAVAMHSSHAHGAGSSHTGGFHCRTRQSPNLKSSRGSYGAFQPPSISPGLSFPQRHFHSLSFSAVAADSSSNASALSVNKDDTFFLWQGSTKNWVCVRPDPSESLQLRLELAGTKCEMDDFRLLRVPPSLGTGISFIRQLIYFLQPLSSENDNQIYLTLRALHQFLMASSDSSGSDHDLSNGHEGHGASSSASSPDLLATLGKQARQQLVREMGVLKTVVDLYIPQTRNPSLRPTQFLHMAISILDAAVSGCPENAEYCAENFLGCLLEWLGWSAIDQLLLVILQSYSAVSEEDAHVVTTKILTKIRPAPNRQPTDSETIDRADKVKYLDMLSALCTKGGEGVPTFQKVVLKEILMHQVEIRDDYRSHQQVISDLLLPIPFQKGIYVVVGGTDCICIAGFDSLNAAQGLASEQTELQGDEIPGMADRIDEVGSTVPEIEVDDDSEECNANTKSLEVGQALQDMVASLRLIGSACVGCAPGDANHVAVLRLISFDTVFRLARDRHVPIDVRAASLQLIERIFLCHRDDLAPPPVFPVNYFVWHEIESGKSAWLSPMVHVSLALKRGLRSNLVAGTDSPAGFHLLQDPTLQTEPESSSTSVATSPEMQIGNLKRMVFDYLESPLMKSSFVGSIGSTQSEQLSQTQHFSVQVVSVLKVLVRRGFFDSNELDKLLIRIIKLLQPNTQIATSWQLITNETRDFRRRVLTGCCDVLHYVLDLQLNARLYSVFARAKDILRDIGDLRSEKVKSLLRSSLLEDFMSWSEPSKSNPTLTIKSRVAEVLSLLVDLALVSEHKDVAVAAQAMHFLLRFFNQHHELKSRIPETQLFLSKSAQPVHLQLRNIGDRFRSCVEDSPNSLDADSKSLLTRAISLLGTAEEPLSHIQCIALDLGIHSTLLQLMRSLTDLDSRSECHKFFQKLCKNNPIAQDHLFSQLELVAHSTGHRDDVFNAIRTLTEIFSANPGLASQISKTQIRMLASLLDFGFLHAEGLRLLQILIAPFGIQSGDDAPNLISVNQFRVSGVLTELLDRCILPLLEAGSDKEHLLLIDPSKVSATEARSSLRLSEEVSDVVAKEKFRDFVKFHLELLSTFVMCGRSISAGRGAHAGTEIMQQILPLTNIRERICNAKMPFAIRSAYLRVFHHIWVFPSPLKDLMDLFSSLDFHLIIAGIANQLDELDLYPISPGIRQEATPSRGDWLEHVLCFLNNLVSNPDVSFGGGGGESLPESPVEHAEKNFSSDVVATGWSTDSGLTGENRVEAWAHLASALRRVVRVADSYQALVIAELFEMMMVNCKDFSSEKYAMLREQTPAIWREVAQTHQATITMLLATLGEGEPMASHPLVSGRKTRLTAPLMANPHARHSMKLTRIALPHPQISSTPTGIGGRTRRYDPTGTKLTPARGGIKLAPLRDITNFVAREESGGISEGSMSSISPAIGVLDETLQELLDSSPPEKCFIKFLESLKPPKMFKDPSEEEHKVYQYPRQDLSKDENHSLIHSFQRLGSALAAATSAGAAALKGSKVQPISGSGTEEIPLAKDRRDMSLTNATDHLASKLVQLAGGIVVRSVSDANALTVLIDAVCQLVSPTADKGEEEEEDDTELTEEQSRQKTGAANGRKRCFVNAGACQLSLSLLTTPYDCVLTSSLRLACALLFDGFREGQEAIAEYLLSEDSASETVFLTLREHLRKAKGSMRDAMDKYKRLEKFNSRGRDSVARLSNRRKSSRADIEGGEGSPKTKSLTQLQVESKLRLVVTGRILLDIHKSESYWKDEDHSEGRSPLEDGDGTVEIASEILDLMRWMCEGQFEPLQTILREQPKEVSRVSINLVRDTMDFLIVVSDLLSLKGSPSYDEAERLCVKCIDALAECSIDRIENLEFLALNTDFLRVLKTIFTECHVTFYTPPELSGEEGKLENYTPDLLCETQSLSVHLSAITIVRLLLSGSTTGAPNIRKIVGFKNLTRLLDSLGDSAHFKTLAKLIGYERIHVDAGEELQSYSKYWSRAGMATFREMQEPGSTLSSQWEAFVKVKYNLGFALIGVLHTMLDNMTAGVELEKARYQLEKIRCFKFFSNSTGRIEVSRNDTIVRQYFPVDILARAQLTAVMRDSIRWNAVSIADGSLLRQLEYFVDSCDKVSIDLEHRVRLSRKPYVRIATGNMTIWVSMVLLLAWAVNLTVILTMKGDPLHRLGVIETEGFDWKDPKEQDTLDGPEGIAMTVFKVLQCFFVAVLYLSNVILEAPASVMRGIRQRFRAYKIAGMKKLGISEDMEIVEVFSCGFRKVVGDVEPLSAGSFFSNWFRNAVFPGRLVLFEDSICFLSSNGVGDMRVAISDVEKIEMVYVYRFFPEIRVHMIDWDSTAMGRLHATKATSFTHTTKTTRSNKVCYVFQGFYFPNEVLRFLNAVKVSKPIARANRLRDFGFRLRYFLQTNSLLYNSIYVMFTILGVVKHPFFYAFQLLDIVPRSKLLQKVLQAVTKNLKSIVLTFLLLAVCVYIYAVIGFYFFRDRFTVGGPKVLTYNNVYSGEDVTQISTGINSQYRFCDTLFWCLVGQLSISVRNGGTAIGEQDPCFDTSPGSPSCQGVDNYAVPTFFRYMYDLSFYIIIIVVLLNIVLGIIIDGFGELRQVKETTEKQIATTCFICGQNRYDFDHVDSYSRHVKDGTTGDHCMWNYLFFLNYLDTKKKRDFDSVEAYVANCRRRNDFTWFPLNKAIVLQNVEAEQDAVGQKLDEFRSEMNSKMDMLMRSQTKGQMEEEEEIDE